MISKIISLEIRITQDDIDYLARRAFECLKKMLKEKNPEEHKRLTQLFWAYLGYWLVNKDNALPKS